MRFSFFFLSLLIVSFISLAQTNESLTFSHGPYLQNVSETSATIPECNRVYLGTVGTSTSVQKYTQSEVKLYNTRLSNSELAALTS